MHHKTRIALLTVCALFSLRISNASTIISIAEPTDGNNFELGGSFHQTWVEGWTDSQAESGVSIQVTVEGDPRASITAYLTNKIGSGTTAANNEIASTTFSPNGIEIDLLFSGLSLPAGSYYLVMTGAAANTQGWDTVNAGGDPIVQAPSVSAPFSGVVNSFNGTPNAYAPASTFLPQSVEFEGLSMDVESVPEPSTFALAGAGFLLAARLRRRAQ